eukprot:m.113340 g.113340  ORF g.113340 m.113340 type:complete len:200 (+) comp17077_c0_seq2:232-831(+)
MFVLAELSDVARISPAHFSKNRLEQTELELNKKYANKVIKGLGLCIMLHDILTIGDSLIYPGDGAAQLRVRFRLVVFRPFVDEILEGTIRSCSEKGVHVTMGFFEDILIPASQMQPNTVFDTTEQAWCWQYGDEKLFMDVDEKIYFKVIKEEFHDMVVAAEIFGAAGGDDTDGFSNRKAPYMLTGSVNDFGLGLPAWWE